MIGLLLAVFVFVALLSFCEKYIGRYKWTIYIVIGIVLILMAAFKVVGNDDDSENYELFFLNYDDPYKILSVEYSFLLLSSIVSKFTYDVHGIFLVYALIGITAKFIAIKRMAKLLFLPLLVYISHYFILHDMIEIRVSVAAAFFMLAIKPLCDGEKRKAFVYMCVAVFFHYSAFVLFPLLFFNNETLSKRMRYILAAIVPMGYLAYFAGVDLLTTIPIPYIGSKLEVYRELKDFGHFEEIYVFKNPLLLMKITVFYLLLVFYDTVYEYNKELPMLMKIMGISLACFFFFSSLPVLSGRLYELFGVVDIFLFPCIVYVFRPQYIAKIFVFLMCFISIFMDVFIYELIR